MLILVALSMSHVYRHSSHQAPGTKILRINLNRYQTFLWILCIHNWEGFVIHPILRKLWDGLHPDSSPPFPPAKSAEIFIKILTPRCRSFLHWTNDWGSRWGITIFPSLALALALPYIWSYIFMHIWFIPWLYMWLRHNMQVRSRR